MAKVIKMGDHYVHPVKKDGNTDDIIQTIEDADKCNEAYVGNSSELMGDTILETCHNIYNFVRENIPYKEDEKGVQRVQSPGELWNNRLKSKGGTGKGGDCKSMSLFCSAILKSLGMWYFLYRFVSEEPDEDLYHVYLIVRDDTGEGYVILDCTLDTFNKELNIALHLDLPPAEPGSECPFPRKGASVGATYNTSENAAQNSGDQWAAHEFAYKNSYANNPNYITQLQNQIVQEIITAQNKPFHGAAYSDFIVGNWDQHVKAAALMYPHYWDDTSLYMAELTGKPYPPLTQVDILIGNANMSLKKENATNLHDDLISAGFSEQSLKELVQISMWNNHGVTLDYMIYRCKNKLIYGQEWGPEPGIPYYDANTKTFYPNGATSDEVTALKNAFPLEGGTGKPWGLPYIAKGIFIMTNGADDATLAAFSQLTAQLGWSGYINTYIYPGKNDVYTPISDADQLAATQMYYKWQMGQLPVLYSGPVDPNLQILSGQPIAPPNNPGHTTGVTFSGPRVGVVELTSALVAAIIAAVVAILTLIANIVVAVLKSKQAALQANPAIAPADFKLQYQCADGCYIGYTSTCSSGVGKACSTGFTCNPDLKLPANGPINQNNVPPVTGPGGAMSKYLPLALAGVGLLALTSNDN